MKQMTLKPRKGVLVRKPDGLHLAEKGEVVPRNAYWLRRLREGDVIEVKDLKGAK